MAATDSKFLKSSQRNDTKITINHDKHVIILYAMY